jgi:hypothetical protein
VEGLEDRTVLSTYTAATVPELIAAIDAANLTPEADTIALATGTTFTLTEVNNTTNGPTGLPTIAANSGNLTIIGNGDIIERSTASGTPAFRLFDVAAGASLRLESLTLQGGLAVGARVWAQGGAVHNQGNLDLNGVTMQNNIAQSGTDWDGVPAAGGAIFSNGSLTLQGGAIQNNQALGGFGSDGGSEFGGGGASGRNGGDAFGGGVYVGAGTAILAGAALSGNKAQGGDGGDGGNGGRRFEGGWGGAGGNGFGGGLYAAAGSIELHDCSVTQNVAKGGAGGRAGSGSPRGQNGSPGLGIGGGFYIDSDVLACLDAFTVSNLKKNKASTSDPNVHGSYSLCD